MSRIADLIPGRRPRPPEWAVPCPVQHCLARPGAACTSPSGRRLTAGSHPSRLDAHLVQQHTSASSP